MHWRVGHVTALAGITDFTPSLHSREQEKNWKGAASRRERKASKSRQRQGAANRRPTDVTAANGNRWIARYGERNRHEPQHRGQAPRSGSDRVEPRLRARNRKRQREAGKSRSARCRRQAAAAESRKKQPERDERLHPCQRLSLRPARAATEMRWVPGSGIRERVEDMVEEVGSAGQNMSRTNHQLSVLGLVDRGTKNMIPCLYIGFVTLCLRGQIWHNMIQFQEGDRGLEIGFPAFCWESCKLSADRAKRHFIPEMVWAAFRGSGCVFALFFLLSQLNFFCCHDPILTFARQSHIIFRPYGASGSSEKGAQGELHHLKCAIPKHTHAR